MAVDETSVASLMKLGLTEYEARIYLALVKMGSKIASEISFLSKVPRTKTYGAVKSLKEKGLLRILPGKPERYLASSPGEVLQPLADKLNRDAQSCGKLVDDLSLIYESSKYIYSDKPYERYDVWTLSERGKVSERVKTLIENSSKSVRIATTANGLVRAFKAYYDAFELASNKGVDIMLIATISRENASLARKLTGLMKIRHNPPPVVEYVSTDSKEVIFIESSPDNFEVREGHDVAAWTNSPMIAKITEGFFDRLWSALPTVDKALKKLA